MNTLTTEEKIRLFNGVGSWETFSADGKIPSIFMSDGPHGLRKQEAENYADLNKSNPATCFPTASCIASSWDLEAAAELGKAIAREALAEKVNLVLGPGMNLKRSPLCGRNFEYFSEDPHLTGRIATAYVNGMQSSGVGSCIKHFACNNQEKRRQTSSSNMDEHTLQDLYLRAFEYTVKNAQPAAVMCSYNRINGTYAAADYHLLTELLRNNWEFNGAVISDWGACINAPECLKAGMDLAMPDSHGYFDNQLKKALANQIISESDLDKANERVLNMVKRCSPEDKNISSEPVDYTLQHKTALELAEASAVLLKNNGILPLSPENHKKITVIGEMAEIMKFQGGGSSHITTRNYPNALEALEKAGFNITYEKGYFSGFCKRSAAAKRNAPLIKSALRIVEKLSPEDPVLLFCGLTEAFEGEGFDRKDLQLPPEQKKLLTEILRITRNVTVISFSGAPIDLTCAENASAVLHMYLCGEACGEAVADLISGKVNPSGHLAETWPLNIGDTPCFKTFAPDDDNVNYSEGMLIGYQWYNSKNIPVQYPFGYGLSYTNFTQRVIDSKLKVDSANGFTKIHAEPGTETAEVIVKNTGKVSGAEVVQVYINGELSGFTKIKLESGEEKTVTIPLENYTCKIPAESPEAQPVSENYRNPKLDRSEGFTISDSLIDMSKKSFRIRILLKILETAIVITSHKSKEDPSVKITLSALFENPLESLISTSGGLISEKLARKIVKLAN